MPKKAPTPKIIGASDVARMLGCDIRTVHRMVADGRIPTVGKLAGQTGEYLFESAEIKAIVAKSRTVVRIPKASA